MTAVARGRRVRAVALLAASSLVIGACAVMPTGPGVMALPGTGKSVGQYQVDAAECRQYADAVIAAGGEGTAAADSACTAMSSWQLQRGYDSAYLQCMYARGNRVPARAHAGGPSRPVYLDRAPGASPTAPAGGYPPPENIPPSSYPPPGTPPPAGFPPRGS